MKMRFLVVSCCMLALLSACKREEKVKPPFAGGGGTNTVGVGSEHDASTGGGDDAGMEEVDAGPPSPDALFCKKINPIDAMNEDLPFNMRASGVSVPNDFRITRQVARWNGSCAAPEILIKLSSGRCPTGDGHELEITLTKSALEDGVLTLGENILLPEPDNRGVTFRYTRPRRLAPSGKVGTWGTCAGASGQIVFADLPDLTRKSNLAARFLLTLTPCMKEDIVPIDVTGAFNVELPGFGKYCPTDGGTPPTSDAGL